MNARNRANAIGDQESAEAWDSANEAWQKEEDRRQNLSDADTRYNLDPQRPLGDRPEMTPGWDERRRSQLEQWQGMAGRPTGGEEAEYAGLEIPDWMQGFMTDSGFGQGRETDRSGSGSPQQDFGFGLAPMSAQADLDVEDMAGLQGYLGWSKAGRPTRYSQDYAQSMQNMPNWWEKYIKESQKLFPQSGRARTANWSTARQ